MKNKIVVALVIVVIGAFLVPGPFQLSSRINFNNDITAPDSIKLTGPPKDAQPARTMTQDKQSKTALQAPDISRRTIGDRITQSDKLDLKNVVYRALAATNDPLSNQDWESQINLSQMRDFDFSGTTTKVAVIDGGFALDHQDLSSVWATNSGESGPTTQENPSILNCSDQNLPLDMSCNVIDDDFDGTIDNETGPTIEENTSLLNCSDQGLSLDKSCNLIDDDGNILVDDYRGFDFINFERSVQTGEVNPDDSEASHGTMVTGLIGAIVNNNLGLAGIAQNVEILPIQALSDDGLGFSVSVAESIFYAVDQGADIINLSLGTDFADGYSRSAIEYAAGNGVTVIAASGNDNTGEVLYPAAYKGVIAVGALDTNGERASFSNYGDMLDISAPGVSIASTGWSKNSETNFYQVASGTSFASPIVAGIAANLHSYQPDLTPIQIRALLSEQSDKSMLNEESWSNIYGHGAADALASVDRLSSPIAPAQLTTFGQVRSGQSLAGDWNRLEIGAVVPYKCQPGTLPTTPVFELAKSNRTIISLSELEVAAAKDNGYISSRMFDACILMPNDNPEILRELNTPKEFLNLTTKPQY